MTPVDQTTFGKGGNCFSACVASILELPIERVPYFMDDESVDGLHWWHRFQAWCETNGVVTDFFYAEDLAPAKAPAGYVIMSGTSPRSGKGHAVVALDGVCVHDPHVGDRRGIVGEPWDYITVEWKP